MIIKRRRSAPLLNVNSLHVFSLVTLAVAFILMVIEVTALGAHGCGGMSVDIPRVYNAVAVRGAARFDAMIIAIAYDGKVYFGSDVVPCGRLPQLVAKGLSEGAQRKVYLRVDRGAKYGVVSQVLAEVRSSGIENVAFLVEKRIPVGAAAYAP